jgi:hypothetical protein
MLEASAYRVYLSPYRRGAPDEADRLNVIAYLRTLADAPVPLP